MTIAEANEPVAYGLRIIIKKMGLKNLNVAKEAGYTAQELCDMLNGRRLIKACDIQNIAIAIGVTVNDIYKAGKEGEVDAKTRSKRLGKNYLY